LLASATRDLAHNDEVIVFAGSAEVPARIAILDGTQIAPGEDGWAQVRLARPLVALPQDRFILRRPSPAETIGGGIVLEIGTPRHKRHANDVVARLEKLAAGDPAERMLATIGSQFVEAGASLDAESLGRLLADGRLVSIGSFVAREDHVSVTRTRVIENVESFHRDHPLQPGMPLTLLGERVQLARPVLEALLSTTPALKVDGAVVRRADFEIVLDPDRERRVEAYLQSLLSSSFQPPTPDEVGIEPELTRALTHLGAVVEIGDGIVFMPEQIAAAREVLEASLAESDSISLAEYRDRLGTTRRYAQALLEYFDRQRITRRIGDRRVAVRSNTRAEDEPIR
jgi:selenocysteine-specific elongation factor